jgi:hypothetical protein
MTDKNTPDGEQKPEAVVVDKDKQVIDPALVNQNNQNPAPAKEEETVAVVPEDKQDEQPKEEDKQDTPLDTSVWGDTGSESGNAVLKKLQDSGVKVETAKALLYDAVQSGDPTKIDKAALVAAVGEASANIILTGVDNFVKENRAAVNAVITTLHNEVGGEENWNTLRDWAKANLKPEEVQEYVDMIDKGGRQAALAAKDLNARYETAGNTSLVSKQVVPSANQQQQSNDVKPLSSREYFLACEKAQRDGTYATVRANLLAGRNAGKAKGI